MELKMKFYGAFFKYRCRKFKKIGSQCHFARGYNFIGERNISIGNRFIADKNLMLQTWETYRGTKTGIIPQLVIGDDVNIMRNCQISCANKITIGNGTLFGDNVFITDNFHGKGELCEMQVPPIERTLYIKGEVVIGNNVWIGRNVCIMPGVHIGDGAIIGANAVVTKDIPANSRACGVPAAVIDNKIPYEN